jgi:hypothetical protein
MSTSDIQAAKTDRAHDADPDLGIGLRSVVAGSPGRDLANGNVPEGQGLGTARRRDLGRATGTVNAAGAGPRVRRETATVIEVAAAVKTEAGAIRTSRTNRRRRWITTSMATTSRSRMNLKTESRESIRVITATTIIKNVLVFLLQCSEQKLFSKKSKFFFQCPFSVLAHFFPFRNWVLQCNSI